MKIAFIGIGHVGAALAKNLLRLGHEVTVAARDPQSDAVKNSLALVPGLRVAPMVEGVASADLVFFSAPFQAVEPMLRAAGGALAGKALVDCSNPIGADLAHALRGERSGAEVVQSLAPGARVVKAFSIYDVEALTDAAAFGGAESRPAMLIAGDDAAAKKTVAEVCRALGWEAVDAGALPSALHLEHLALLGMKMARVHGRDLDFAWATLPRTTR